MRINLLFICRRVILRHLFPVCHVLFWLVWKNVHLWKPLQESTPFSVLPLGEESNLALYDDIEETASFLSSWL